MNETPILPILSDGQTRRSRFQKAYSTDVNSVNSQRFQPSRYNQPQKRHHWSRGVASSSSSVAAGKGQTRRKLTFDVKEKCESQENVLAGDVQTIARNKIMTLSEASTDEEKSRLLHNSRPDDPGALGRTLPSYQVGDESPHATQNYRQQATQRLKASKPIMVNDKSQKFRKSLLMTQSMTSSQSGVGGQFDTWRLMRQDFLPGKDQPEQFTVLVEKANDWLKKQPEVKVKSCETITCMFSDRYWPTNFESMLQSKTILPNVANHNVRGLRLWLVPRGPANQLQALQVVDFLPTSIEDDVASLVQKINNKIADNTLRGQIVTIETISVAKKTPDNQTSSSSSSSSSSSCIDSNATYWSEWSSQPSSYVIAIRVFTNKEANGRICGSEKVFVGLQDLIPMKKRFLHNPVTNGDSNHRRNDVTNPADDVINGGGDDDDDYDVEYEGFEDLIERASMWMNEMWMREEENFLALNLQSLVVQKCCDKKPGSDCYYTMPAMDSGQQVDMLRILRIYYLNPLGTLLIELPPQIPLNFHTISPEVKDVSKPQGQRKGQVDGGKSSRSKRKLETMTELMKRTNDFLLGQGSTEEIINPETVVNLVFDSVYLSGQNADRNDDVKFLLTIRLYTIARRDYTKKLASLAAGVTSSVDNDYNNSSKILSGSSKIGGCSFETEESHPGPIFLGHVVNRSYKYRWLVAGATVIFCMTVVVIVSVAYSNVR